MSNVNVQLDRQLQNAVVLANAGEFVAGVVKEIVGNDISTSINGNTATSEIIQMLAHQRIVNNVSAKN